MVEGVTRATGVRPRCEVPSPVLWADAFYASRPCPSPPPASAPRCWSASAQPGRSELVRLALGDVERVPKKGMLLTIRRSKTDRHGAGQRAAIWPTAPIAGSGRSPRSTPGCATAAPPPISTGPPARPCAPSDRCPAPSPTPARSPGQNAPSLSRCSARMIGLSGHSPLRQHAGRLRPDSSQTLCLALFFL